MSRRRRRKHDPVLDDDDPLAGLVNLFDIAIVFAMGLVIALVLAMRHGRFADRAAAAEGAPSDATGAPTPASAQRVSRYRETRETARGDGTRLGTAYRLPSGEVVYVPGE